jgi:hypothetical protein
VEPISLLFILLATIKMLPTTSRLVTTAAITSTPVTITTTAQDTIHTQTTDTAALHTPTTGLQLSILTQNGTMPDSTVIRQQTAHSMEELSMCMPVATMGTFTLDTPIRRTHTVMQTETT